MALLVLILLLGMPVLAQQQDPEQGQAPVFRTGATWVRVDVQAGEKGRLLDKLTKDDFVVYDNGQPQKILYFGRDTEPLDVLLLLDVSGSMRRYLEQMAIKARQALEELHPGDRVGVMCFSRRTEIEEDLTPDRARVITEIQDAVHEQSLGSGTRINPAILDAAEYMRKDPGLQGAGADGVPRPGRRAILIVTDNESLNYLVPDDKVIQALLDADTVLNAIVVGKGTRPKPPKPGEYVNPDFTPTDVFHIAQETGGEAVKAERPGETFRDMMESIRTRYNLQYAAPPQLAPGTFRRIQVELSPEQRRKHPNAWIRARSGYIVK